MSLSLEELQAHLHSLPDRPDAIPYVTSYYQRDWGFCLSDNARQKLASGTYRAVIDSELKPGSLTYGELILPGRDVDEVFFSTYICHPSLANNELSGPVVATQLAKWINNLENRKHTYRFVFAPETIGSIVYLSKHLEYLKNNVVAGFNVSCVGDDRDYTYLASRNGNTLADRIVKHVLKFITTEYTSYSYLQRGSDERQYCAPGVDLPMVSLMRTRYGDYPEYHTSDDDLSLISSEGLFGGFKALAQCVLSLEANERFQTTTIGEPQLGRRGLISNLGYGPSGMEVNRRLFSHLIAYCDGGVDLLELAELIGVPVTELERSARQLQVNGLLSVVP